jgi:glycosyltransferase involved in cell wall biosynthesis
MGSAPLSMSRPELHVSLDSPLPRDVRIGRGTALFIAGTCFCPTAEIAALDILVDGVGHPVIAHGMPRLDFFAELHPGLDPFATAEMESDPGSSADPWLRSYCSGFWGITPIPEDAREVVRVTVRARLADGTFAEAELDTIRRVGAIAEPPPDSPASPANSDAGELVAICMATYNPPPELFAAQIASIRAQTHRNWICVISDDRSDDEGSATIRREVDGDRRFVVSVAPRRLGFYNNFERSLSLAPRAARFVAMADQDDRWYPDKLARLLVEIGDAQLVYSDQRVIARDGKVLSDTYWGTRRNNHDDLLSLLVANSVTGAASLVRRELLDDALPFPPAQFAHFHDHWIALVALARGDIAFVSEPLYDYVQHHAASLGHAAANQRRSLRQRFADQRDPHERVRMWRLHYFVDVARLLTLSTILRMRCGSTLSRRKRLDLWRFESADRSLPAALALGLRGLADMNGTTETLGAEWMLFHAFVWRRLLAATARPRPQRRWRLDAVPPPSLALKPASVREPGAADAIADKIAPLDLAVSDEEPARVNLLIPTVDLAHFFGGYIGKLNLARRLAEEGRRVRLVTVDPVGPLPRDWKRRIESYSGLSGLFDTVEVEFGRGPSPVQVSPEDRFIATTWWTAHIAAAACRVVGRKRFVYLIQEYEPFTFSMGTYAALARESYDFPHYAVFSTELLRAYFRRHRIGVFGAGVERGDHLSVSFQNAITDVVAPTTSELAARATRKLLFYARPEDHAARNMFELGVLALSQTLERDGALDGWELWGIGTVGKSQTVALGGGASLRLLPRLAQDEYARLLREHDVGLALMYTPHPSLVPIEMAAGGLVTVTNSFENKTAAAMATISSNLIAAPPTVEGVTAGLRDAVAAAADHATRVRASDVKWSRDWRTSLPESLLAQIGTALDES